jgi:hypothetical protein
MSYWPLFSDHGHLIAASNVLVKEHGIPLNLKYCTEHIVQNVIHKYKVNAPLHQALKKCILAIQAASNVDGYCSALDRLCTRFNMLEYLV